MIDCSITDHAKYTWTLRRRDGLADPLDLKQHGMIPRNDGIIIMQPLSLEYGSYCLTLKV